MLKQLAILYYRIGAWREAEKIGTEVLDMAHEAENQRMEIEVLILLGNFVREQGRVAEAEELVDRAERIARDAGTPRASCTRDECARCSARDPGPNGSLQPRETRPAQLRICSGCSTIGKGSPVKRERPRLTSGSEG